MNSELSGVGITLGDDDAIEHSGSLDEFKTTGHFEFSVNTVSVWSMSIAFELELAQSCKY